MRKKILFCIILICSLDLAFATNEALTIWEMPKSINIRTINTYPTGNNIIVKEVQYTSSTYKGEPIKIFGYFCYPTDQTSLPAVVIVHGGGGYAVLPRAIEYAERGYAAIAIDLPGKGENRNHRSRSTGPDMDVPTLLRVSPDIKYNYLYHAVIAARSAITFLEDQPFVEKNKIGMVGLSWGGVITLIVNGTDARLAAAVPVFGSGYLDQGSTWQLRFWDWMSEVDRQKYAKYFDAKNYMGTQHAPLLYMTGSNDHCFYLPIFIKSYLGMPAGIARLAIYPNGRHHVSPPMHENIFRFLDSKLKGGLRCPDISVLDLFDQGDYLVIPIKYKGPSAAVKVSLFYSKSGIDKWTIKYWNEMPAAEENGTYYALIPKGIISPEIVFYAALKDESGAYVTTPAYSLMRLKISDGRNLYIASTPIEERIYHRISPQTWEQIVKKPCDIPGDKIFLANLERIGAKIKNKRFYYYIELPATK